MRCPRCRGHNTAEASWCTQCLEPLATSPSEPTASEAPVPGAAPPPSARVRSRGAAGSPADVDADRPFRSVDGEVEWRCPGCASWNLLATPTCSVCGRALASSGRDADRFADRVARARRPLWALAMVGAAVMVGSVILLLLALRDGAGV